MILNENSLADIGSFVETAGVRRGELLAHKEEGLRVWQVRAACSANLERDGNLPRFEWG
jgi:hypothetical protein